MPTIDHLLAEMAIRQLHVKYADAVWRKDFVAFGDCFAEDCEWRIGGMIMRGRGECPTGIHLRPTIPDFRTRATAERPALNDWMVPVDW